MRFGKTVRHLHATNLILKETLRLLDLKFLELIEKKRYRLPSRQQTSIWWSDHRHINANQSWTPKNEVDVVIMNTTKSPCSAASARAFAKNHAVPPCRVRIKILLISLHMIFIGNCIHLPFETYLVWFHLSLRGIGIFSCLTPSCPTPKLGVNATSSFNTINSVVYGGHKRECNSKEEMDAQ